MGKQQDIKAERGGIVRNFHPKTWAAFPPDKYGYVQVSNTPPPVPAAVEKALIGRPPAHRSGGLNPVPADVPRGHDDVNSD